MVNPVHGSEADVCGDSPHKKTTVPEVRHYPRVPDPQKLTLHPTHPNSPTCQTLLTLTSLNSIFASVLTNLKSLNFTFFGTFPLPAPLTLYSQGDAQSISCVAPGEPGCPSIDAQSYLKLWFRCGCTK